jgi:hypothetical protein
MSVLSLLLAVVLISLLLVLVLIIESQERVWAVRPVKPKRFE